MGEMKKKPQSETSSTIVHSLSSQHTEEKKNDPSAGQNLGVEAPNVHEDSTKQSTARTSKESQIQRHNTVNDFT